MIAASRLRLLSVAQRQSRNQIQNHILGLKSVKSAPKIFTPPDSSPATACRELGARLPASGLPNFSRPPSLSFLSSPFSSSPSLIPRVLSSRVLHTTAKMSNEIVHPTIQAPTLDGWFREISNMWPGQAMTLKVEKVLHHEKSQYQDVLIFKSTDYGNVLVLDNVIQATERDEFSYQEMITHLAMNSHPNPKKVLVIGGGDGGVLREVVKHDCVEEAILCDIDEAVIRLSKQFLPHMSVGFDHPKSKTHVGDGFKFLDDYKNTFDVIITDSSDPEGPAESLFKKPYFQLLHDALREGGVITTQGSENQWLHLPLITQLKKDCKEIFPVAEYAYTTIPTYPSGQIGFMVCCKDANRNVRVPLRSWTPEEEEQKCRYYNAEIHKASFILPTFAKKALE
ncbi:spermidine-3 [Trichoderma gamsii]|uniref:Spermidine-3 n=1 Tax=Trichoderma gamsii TaxID=398673 RepID=A0A2P4ZYB9_9HYPO|nr:spermidine-3 [Trichoderma gamsii]PON29304.1 spermidine-3 [Trichoderma gamsii]